MSAIQLEKWSHCRTQIESQIVFLVGAIIFCCLEPTDKVLNLTYKSISSKIIMYNFLLHLPVDHSDNEKCRTEINKQPQKHFFYMYNEAASCIFVWFH